ncbi:MAG: MoaD/ThiS family protein [Actinobacteria bacterium]|nr:MoaD/ThiS family protein [Actinomycetota bacterium]
MHSPEPFQPPIEVTVRLFAAAREAAGADALTIGARNGMDLVVELESHTEELRTTLPRCSFLVAGTSHRFDQLPTVALEPGLTIDVLPPFAGG